MIKDVVQVKQGADLSASKQVFDKINVFYFLNRNCVPYNCLFFVCLLSVCLISS